MNQFAERWYFHCTGFRADQLTKVRFLLHRIGTRGVINGKAGKKAALPKFSNALTLSQPGRADSAQPLALPYLEFFVSTPLEMVTDSENYSLSHKHEPPCGYRKLELPQA